jgi:cytochrome c-type biogenesis protein CcmH
VTAFWIGVAALCAVALAFLLLPLWRQRRETGRWSASALVAVALTVPLAVALYLNVRTWQPDALQQRSEEAALVASLAERMAQQPEDVEGWRLLGR